MLLEVKNITKIYHGNEVPAINGLSLKVKRNEFVSILGESGCGKSTFLRLINGLDDTSSGDIYINGERVKGPKDLLVPGHPLVEKVDQDYDSFPNHTVRETLEYKLRQFDEGYQQKRIRHLFKLCKLNAHENSIPRLMSGGEQQRVALAAALATSPEILLMDEPFSHLDPSLRRTLKHEIKEIVAEEEVAVIFVTHDAQDALALSDRIVVMRKGKIIQKGLPSTLYSNPKTKYTAEFFGPINDLRELLNSPESKFKRPEDISLSVKKGHKTITGIVQKTEYWGFQNLVSIKIGTQTLYCFTTETLELNQEVYLSLK